MQIKRTKSQLFFLYLSWISAAACMLVIWLLSAQISSQSSELSGGFIKKLTELFNISISQNVIRKTAHALEYAGLCLLFSWSWFNTFRKPQYSLAFLSAALYSSADEIHQYFVPGRACQLRDVYIDCLGAAAGLLCFFVLYKIVNKLYKAR